MRVAAGASAAPQHALAWAIIKRSSTYAIGSYGCTQGKGPHSSSGAWCQQHGAASSTLVPRLVAAECALCSQEGTQSRRIILPYAIPRMHQAATSH